MSIEQINKKIKELGNADLVSDGYHTFKELYSHRCVLFVALCSSHRDYCYWTYKNSDGSEWDNWFLLVLNHPVAGQISYHLPTNLLKNIKTVIEYKDICDDYDGHTSTDVIKRLEELVSYEFKDKTLFHDQH